MVYLCKTGHRSGNCQHHVIDGPYRIKRESLDIYEIALDNDAQLRAEQRSTVQT